MCAAMEYTELPCGSLGSGSVGVQEARAAPEVQSACLHVRDSIVWHWSPLERRVLRALGSSASRALSFPWRLFIRHARSVLLIDHRPITLLPCLTGRVPALSCLATLMPDVMPSSSEGRAARSLTDGQCCSMHQGSALEGGLPLIDRGEVELVVLIVRDLARCEEELACLAEVVITEVAVE